MVWIPIHSVLFYLTFYHPPPSPSFQTPFAPLLPGVISREKQYFLLFWSCMAAHFLGAVNAAFICHKKRPGGSTNSIVKAKLTDTPKQRTSAFKARPSQCRVCFSPAKILNHADGWGAFPWLKVSSNTPSIPAMHPPFSPIHQTFDFF